MSDGNKRSADQSAEKLQQPLVDPVSRSPLSAVSVFTVSLLLSSAAAADFCPERPGQTTPTCTLAPGDYFFEASVIDWSRQRGGGEQSDDWLYIDSVLRFGLTDRVEGGIGFTTGGRSRVQSDVPGATATSSGIGDLSVGFRLGPVIEGSPFALGFYVTLPTGDVPPGEEDWQSGVLFPYSADLTERLSLGFTPEIDWVPDAEGNDHHISWGGALGLGFTLSDAFSVSADVSAFADEDPDGTTRSVTTSLSLAWQVASQLQLDVGLYRGLDGDGPDIGIYSGLAIGF
ncbi:MAG: transporter [Pseudomonadales bacterium]